MRYIPVFILNECREGGTIPNKLVNRNRNSDIHFLRTGVDQKVFLSTLNQSNPDSNRRTLTL